MPLSGYDIREESLLIPFITFCSWKKSKKVSLLRPEWQSIWMLWRKKFGKGKIYPLKLLHDFMQTSGLWTNTMSDLSLGDRPWHEGWLYFCFQTAAWVSFADKQDAIWLLDPCDSITPVSLPHSSFFLDLVPLGHICTAKSNSPAAICRHGAPAAWLALHPHMWTLLLSPSPSSSQTRSPLPKC